ncbi:L-lactate dehydrogenase [Philodulcilactobacillus myokoensis]|uniref:L-lactate dehydrogenase n=1 Tax=Philodulcilactobacillus myokoensis TaxID=2929573 RepID=A0A9W6ES48_9LACO|nr:L-lactate dehydrogenase [Philodulcilactobacillus myokoensis]GLB46731.1 L-lactate dehydrogenase [Philodulcilactobacillus myokoensis]
MSRKIGVIGIGHVGSTVAHYLVSGGFVDELVLIDKNKAKVVADALDLKEALPNLPYHPKIVVNDYDALKDADVIISSLGNTRVLSSKTSDRFAELPFVSAQVKLVAPKIKASGFNGVIVDISNPCDVITSMYQKLTGLPKNQVMGTGTLLDSARMKRTVGEALHVASSSVSGYNLGEHGNSQFTAWSTVVVLSHPISELVDKYHLDLDQLDQNAKNGGFTIFKGKGYTNYGVATAAVRLANVVMNDANTELPVSNYRKEYGVYLSYPAVIGKQGIVHQDQLNLSDDEKKKLQKSANFIKSKFEQVMNK